MRKRFLQLVLELDDYSVIKSVCAPSVFSVFSRNVENGGFRTAADRVDNLSRVLVIGKQAIEEIFEGFLLGCLLVSGYYLLPESVDVIESLLSHKLVGAILYSSKSVRPSCKQDFGLKTVLRWAYLALINVKFPLRK